LKSTLSPSDGEGFDVINSKGGKWEVRSVSKGGIYFCPSYMVGSGRSFNEKGFLEKLAEIEGYIISDIDAFPKIPFWIVQKEQVLTWWKDEELGKDTSISHKKALALLANR
jgi:hypothetical protein